MHVDLRGLPILYFLLHASAILKVATKSSPTNRYTFSVKKILRNAKVRKILKIDSPTI